MLRRQFLKQCLALAAFPGLTQIASAMGSPIAEGGHVSFYPQMAVPIGKVVVDDAFWSPKIDTWRRTTIDDCLNKFESTGALDNFDRVANGQAGGHHGEPWWDGLIYEMITAASDFLATKPEPELSKRIDGIIDRIAAAAAVDQDGYVNTAVTLSHVAPRWSDPPTPGDMHDDRYPHTLYNGGCLSRPAFTTTAPPAILACSRSRRGWRTSCARSWGRRHVRISCRAMPFPNWPLSNSISFTGNNLR